jgi:hypothetical protein
VRRLLLFRTAVLIVVRDMLIPGSGVYIALTGLTPWKVPLVVGMLGLPIVARGGEPKDGGE